MELIQKAFEFLFLYPLILVIISTILVIFFRPILDSIIIARKFENSMKSMRKAIKKEETWKCRLTFEQMRLLQACYRVGITDRSKLKQKLGVKVLWEIHEDILKNQEVGE